MSNIVVKSWEGGATWPKIERTIQINIQRKFERQYPVVPQQERSDGELYEV
jgi:hypothetical protein